MSKLSGRPLRDTRRDRALFVDREQTMELSEKTLRNGGNVLLVGSRGSGKSSVLRMIARNLGEEGRRALVLDGRATASTEEFLALLRDRLGAWATVPLGEAGALLGQLRDIGRNLPAEQEAIVLVDEMP